MDAKGQLTIIIHECSDSQISKCKKTEQEFSAYIEGPDTIRLDRYCNYKLIGIGELSSEVEFELEGEYAEISEIKPNLCIVHANDKNKLGSVTLTATYNGNNYTKQIKIIPLW